MNRHAYIVGAYEHPTRHAPDKSVAQLHAEVAAGALADAGLSRQDVDGYFCAGDAPGLGPLSMVDYLNLRVRHVDATETGGSSYLVHVAHAAQAIAAGKCNVALITLAGRPRSEGTSIGTSTPPGSPVTTRSDRVLLATNEASRSRADSISARVTGSSITSSAPARRPWWASWPALAECAATVGM